MVKSKAKKPHYTVIIQWDEEDQIFVVSLPEWGSGCKTHGATYEEAAKNAQEVLELLMEGSNDLPSEKHFQYPGADVVKLREAPIGRSPTRVRKLHKQPA
jgi:predicted RNase H-like HicB family nuclease